MRTPGMYEAHMCCNQRKGQTIKALFCSDRVSQLNMLLRARVLTHHVQRPSYMTHATYTAPLSIISHVKHHVCVCVSLTESTPADLIGWYRPEFPLCLDLLEDAFMQARWTFSLRFELSCCHLYRIKNAQNYHFTFQFGLLLLVSLVKWFVISAYTHHCQLCWVSFHQVKEVNNRNSQGWGEVWTWWTQVWPHEHSSLTWEGCLRSPERERQRWSIPLNVVVV